MSTSPNPDCVLEPIIPGLRELGRGKVRHRFALSDAPLSDLVLLASDRISAFDRVLPSGVPGKGALLTQLSEFWFKVLPSAAPHHWKPQEPWPEGLAPETLAALQSYKNRLTRARALTILPVECVVRGALAGSAWAEYQRTGSFHGIELPKGLRLGDELPEAIFTPTTKASSGHDLPLLFSQLVELIGQSRADSLRQRSLQIFSEARLHCSERGLILCDTKFEFGIEPGQELDPRSPLVLADELLTPDSARYFKLADHCPGQSVTAWDKQLVRDYLSDLDWDKTPPAPPLPDEIIKETARRYTEIAEIIMGPAPAPF